ncbi:MAG: FKBP-type peptidyl-prolyl cis-trans isomerase [Flavobacteriia bacterium]
MRCFILLLTFVFLSSCGGEKDKNETVDWNQKKSTDFNKELAIEQELQIKMYLEQRKSWNMIKTGSGLQYYIYEKGEGDNAVAGFIAQVETEISLLDGTQCYMTAKDEMEEFVIDKSDIESGVQEGIKKMRVGDKAKLIIPSHLAHGLTGDMEKIPPLAVIVVDIHLIGLVEK